jgi:SAM-dependent methyltransferase
MKYNYVGSELFIFKNALNWKKYWASILFPHISGDILEVGAGIGANISSIYNTKVKSWSAVEPDKSLLDELERQIGIEKREININLINGTARDVKEGNYFDVILYIDVLEHIENDSAEINEVLNLLKPGGRIIILAPAHKFLFTEFDIAVGHYRRYNKKLIRELMNSKSQSLEETKLIYLDFLGGALSLINRFVLNQSHPSRSQIVFWDSVIIPMSKIIDKLLRFQVGKSILAIYTRS